MVGTAPPSARLLLVEQPGPWGPRGLVDSRADTDTAHEIDQRAAAAGMRLLAVRRAARRDAPADARFVAVVDSTTGTTHRWEVPDLDDLRRQLRSAEGPDATATREALLAAAPGVVADREPLYLVCTHGRHDACCAVRGRPLADALASLRPERVWETTHVGGDRFAANLVVAPSGDTYGRVHPALVADLVERVDRGEVLPALMRGRTGLPPVVQAALVHAHAELGLPARDALSVLASERPADDLALVTLATPTGVVVVEVAVTVGEPAQLTCQGPTGARARVYAGAHITHLPPE